MSEKLTPEDIEAMGLQVFDSDLNTTPQFIAMPNRPPRVAREQFGEVRAALHQRPIDHRTYIEAASVLLRDHPFYYHDIVLPYILEVTGSLRGLTTTNDLEDDDVKHFGTSRDVPKLLVERTPGILADNAYCAWCVAAGVSTLGASSVHGLVKAIMEGHADPFISNREEEPVYGAFVRSLEIHAISRETVRSGGGGRYAPLRIFTISREAGYPLLKVEERWLQEAIDELRQAEFEGEFRPRHPHPPSNQED